MNDTWDEVESGFRQLRFGRSTINAACMYRPPGSLPSYNAQLQKSTRLVTENWHHQVLICGDFYYKEISWIENEVEGAQGSEQAKFLCLFIGALGRVDSGGHFAPKAKFLDECC